MDVETKETQYYGDLQRPPSWYTGGEPWLSLPEEKNLPGYLQAVRQDLGRYLLDLLRGRDCKGPYRVWVVNRWKYITQVKFDKNFGSMCPICKVKHDGYNFEYKAAKGDSAMYGGWKCWKTGSWETHYDFAELDKFVPPEHLSGCHYVEKAPVGMKQADFEAQKRAWDAEQREARGKGLY